MNISTRFHQKTLLAAALGCLALASPLAAQDKMENILKARQGSMQVMALNLGILGGMAKGTTPYDADIAASAANDLAAIGSLNAASYWPEGSDADSVEGSRLLGAAMAEDSKFMMGFEQLQMASAAMAEAAGNGEDAMKAAIGPVGGTCGTCHKAYRAKAN